MLFIILLVIDNKMVDFLFNDLYRFHNEFYKMKSIGDAFMFVSGLRIRIKYLHTREIASMSLH